MKRRAFLKGLSAGGIFVPQIIRAQTWPYTYSDPQMYAKVMANGVHPLATSWATRVVTNGGAAPSGATVLAISNFCYALDTAGLTSQMKAVNVLAPDSLIACCTPLIVGTGVDPWTNSGFSSGAVSVNGLTGDGVNVLNTGVNSSTLSTNSAGMSLYAFKGGVIMGQDYLSSPDFILTSNTFDCWDNSTSRQYSSINDVGFYSGSRTAVGQSNTYYGNTRLSLVQVASTTVASSQNNSALTFPLHLMSSYHHDGGSYDQFISTGTCSFAAIHSGLTQADTAALFTLVQALRVALGGGYNDPVSAWSPSVVANGGAAPSGATVTALSNFYNGLVSDGLVTLVGAVNCCVPDSLIACLTPLLIGGGLNPWTNRNFLAGDLTVNGLVGNGSSKYLQTGVDRSGNNPFSGMAFYSYSVGGVGVELGGSTASAYFQATSKYNDGNNYFFDGATGVVLVASGLSGFYSQQRVSLVDHRAFFANSTHIFAQIGSTDIISWTGLPIGVPPFVLANSAIGVAGQFSTSCISFAAITFGMTSAQTNALYARIVTLRTALGGGYV